MGEPTVCVKALRPPFFTAAAKTGLSIPELVASFDLAPGVLTDLAARVPHSTVVRVWDALADRCDDAGFGLTAATLLGAPQLDLLDHVLQRSPSMRALGASFVRYQRLFHDANDVQFRDDPGGVVASHQLRGDLPRSRHFVEFILAMWVARLRSVLGADRVALQRACFRHAAEADPARYHALFGPHLEFEASMDALVLPRNLLDEPVASGDPTAAKAFEGHLDHELGKLSSASSPDAVRAQIVRLMRAGSEEAFDLGAIARRLAVSRRTLQRRLLEEGTTFRDLIDAARRDVALAELARGTSTVTDLAFLLGFSEHTAFSRAFRRWTGKSPVVYLRAAR
jgi:AraC-like DNA-binding protein